MKTKHDKIKTMTMTAIMVFALIGSTGISSQSAFAGVIPTECTLPPGNMVGWWQGEDNANDIFGVNDGTAQNGVTYDAAKVGQGFSLDGIDDFIEVSDNASLNMTSEITIDAWINATIIDTYKTIVAKGNASANTINYGLQIVAIGGDGTLRFFVNDGTGYKVADSSSQISSDELTHIAVTYNATKIGTNVEFYIDGVSAGSGSIDEPDDTTNNDTLDIGRHRHVSLGDSQYFEGIIDELEIFNRVLDQQEIKNIYDAGSFGKCKSFVEPDDVDVLAHPGEVIVYDKKLTVLDIPEDGPYDVLVEVTNSTSDPCKDALGHDVLTLTNTTATDGIADTPFMLFYDEKVTAMPGVYSCTVEFIANVTLSSNTYSLANQTVSLDVIGSKGYWKNHPDATTIHLPVLLGNQTLNLDDTNNSTTSFNVTTSSEVTEIMNAHKGKFDLDKLAAQLLATKLNLWAWMNSDADTLCIDGNVTAADALLADRAYNGTGTGEKLTKSDKKPALSLHSNLDDFNNNGCQ